MERIADIQFSEETGSLYAFYQEAISFIKNKKWCKDIEDGLVGLFAEGILAVFKFILIPVTKDIDKELWVIVGNIPPAYLVVDNAPDAISALKVYVEEMNLWVEAVQKNKETDKLIPVNVKATKENAIDLKNRLDFITNRVIPNFSS